MAEVIMREKLNRYLTQGARHLLLAKLASMRRIFIHAVASDLKPGGQRRVGNICLR